MRPWLRRALAIALTLAVALTLGLCARRFGFTLVRVTGTSMNGTLSGGDLLLVTRWDYAGGAQPDRGDVVECRFPGRVDSYIKRVVGLPGERVEFSGGALYIDGEAVEEPYVSSPTDDYAVQLNDGEFLVLGDNRAESYDSRMPDMGAIAAEDFQGRVRWVLWPLSHMGPVN